MTLQLFLEKMPSQWINALHQAALECSDDSILELVEQIPPDSQPLAISLREWSENFLFEPVIELTQTMI